MRYRSQYTLKIQVGFIPISSDSAGTDARTDSHFNLDVKPGPCAWKGAIRGILHPKFLQSSRTHHEQKRGVGDLSEVVLVE